MSEKQPAKKKMTFHLFISKEGDGSLLEHALENIKEKKMPIGSNFSNLQQNLA